MWVVKKDGKDRKKLPKLHVL